ncbi:MAG: hypothetical protein AAGA48_08975 [Myxococcota bacterium]
MVRWSVLGTLVACAPPDAEDVPAEIGEATEFLFAHLDDEDPTAIQRVIAETVLPFVLQKLDAIDDPSDPMDPGYYTDLQPLPEGSLGDLSMPEGTTSADQRVPVARVRRTTNRAADFRELAAVTDRTCIESETTHWAERSFLTDADCYARGDCDWLSAVQPTLKVNPLASIWYDQHLEQRELQVEVDGASFDATLARSFLTERWFSRNGNNQWDQLWTLDVTVDRPDGAVTWNAYWSALQVTLLSDAILASSIRAGMVEAGAWADHFVEQGVAHPDCPHERGQPMPERWSNEPG